MPSAVRGLIPGLCECHRSVIRSALSTVQGTDYEICEKLNAIYNLAASLNQLRTTIQKEVKMTKPDNS